jgi:hypothetical protein
MLHALDAARSGPIHILSPDTDVLILALKHQPDLEDAPTIHRSGTNQCMRALKPI